MYAVEVLPIQRGLIRGSLSFFSKTDIPRGSLVHVPIRAKMTPGLVLASRDVREEKLGLKSSTFSLKKIGTAEPRLLIRESIMNALQKAADRTLEPPGAILAALTFAELLKMPRSLENPQDQKPHSGVKPDTVVLMAERAERVRAYRNMVREAFARGKSVIVVCPTLIDVETLSAELSRGIEDRVVVVSSLHSAREQKRAWNAVAHSLPVLLVGTPPVLTFPVRDVDAIVLERESARAYVLRTRPYVDIRVAAEEVADALGARLVKADFPVRVETFARVADGTYEDLARPQARSQSEARVSLVDVRKADTLKNERRSFSALQPGTYEALATTLANGGRAVVYAARKGIAPLTICNDCGTPVTDPATETPMVLHKTPHGNMFMSHRSGAVEPAERSCAVCGGWNLVSLGIGVERVYDELKKRLPNAAVFLFTQETVPTHKVARNLIDQFQEKQNAILVGTERMLPYLPDIPLAVVASIDSILSLSAWRAEERAVSILFQLLEKTRERLIIETRRPDSRVMKAISLRGPMDFLRDELKERHTYGYPPYALFVGLTWAGSEARIAERRAQVTQIFAGLELVGPLPPESIARGQYRERAVVRVDPKEWPSADIAARIAELPPDVLVTVDPDDIV